MPADPASVLRDLKSLLGNCLEALQDGGKHHPLVSALRTRVEQVRLFELGNAERRPRWLELVSESDAGILERRMSLLELAASAEPTSNDRLLRRIASLLEQIEWCLSGISIETAFDGLERYLGSAKGLKLRLRIARHIGMVLSALIDTVHQTQDQVKGVRPLGDTVSRAEQSAALNMWAAGMEDVRDRIASCSDHLLMLTNMIERDLHEQAQPGYERSPGMQQTVDIMHGRLLERLRTLLSDLQMSIRECRTDLPPVEGLVI